MLKDVLIQPPQFLKEDVLEILASLADHPKILILEVAELGKGLLIEGDGESGEFYASAEAHKILNKGALD